MLVMSSNDCRRSMYETGSEDVDVVRDTEHGHRLHRQHDVHRRTETVDGDPFCRRDQRSAFLPHRSDRLSVHLARLRGAHRHARDGDGCSRRDALRGEKDKSASGQSKQYCSGIHNTISKKLVKNRPVGNALSSHNKDIFWSEEFFIFSANLELALIYIYIYIYILYIYIYIRNF